MSLADRYSELRACGRVHERQLFPPRRDPGELELQARWFAGDFGKQFRSVCGKEIEVVQFGTWNREAGPDFQNTAIRIEGGEVLRGSVEFDLSDRSWETHGHATNPSFEDTVLHVFVHASEHAFFTRTPAHRNVLQVRVDPRALPESFAANVPLARPGRCQAPLHGLPEERVRGVLDGAAEFRLQRKTARLRRMLEMHGRDETLFQELAAALGYKQNKLPFTLLAQRLPLATLRPQGEETEALLFGGAGFLEAPDLSVYAGETRTYVRTLWDRWWPHRDSMQRLVLPAALWRLGGARPLNHPQRRLGALAAVAGDWSGFIHSLGEKPAAAGAVRKFLLGIRHPFWEQHYTLTSARAPQQMAMIGASRVAEILANVVLPFLAARGVEVWPAYAELPAQLTNRRLETAVTRLFGGDPRRRQFVRSVAHQQGLLQIYEDFCLQDGSDCAHCPFPEQMQRWS
ncbi:MAG: DUF2851 family protein [Chthoniobacterales bacterium]|nr:DUF2851 family protein [Chthoniobacterales bacterium]